jgi:hypothetical protein
MENLINIGSGDESKSLQQFPRLSEDEIQGLLHPAKSNLGYFLAWVQCLSVSLAALNTV